MRLVATGLLAVMAGLAAVAGQLQASHPWLAWVRAFAEAGLVGGLADWFAVVALFRHPLELPFPHTAIVPRNKDRIGLELGEFVEGNFLTPANIAARLQGVDLAGPAARWLARPANAAQVAAALRSYLPKFLETVDQPEIERLISRTLKEGLERLDIAALAARVLGLLTQSGRHQAVFDQVLNAIGAWLDRNRVALRARFGSQSRFTPKWIDSYVVNRFVDGVIDLVDEVAAAPRHELRAVFDEVVLEFTARLAEDEELRARAEQLKHEVLQHLAPDRFVAALWLAVKRRLTEDSGAALESFLGRSLAGAARELARDRALVARLNEAAVALAETALGRFRSQFSALIADVVRRWDAREVARKIELEVGRDLQFIRLNGTIVGGAAGLAIHAASALGHPFS